MMIMIIIVIIMKLFYLFLLIIVTAAGATSARDTSNAAGTMIDKNGCNGQPDWNRPANRTIVTEKNGNQLIETPKVVCGSAANYHHQAKHAMNLSESGKSDQWATSLESPRTTVSWSSSSSRWPYEPITVQKVYRSSKAKSEIDLFPVENYKNAYHDDNENNNNNNNNNNNQHHHHHDPHYSQNMLRHHRNLPAAQSSDEQILLSLQSIYDKLSQQNDNNNKRKSSQSTTQQSSDKMIPLPESIMLDSIYSGRSYPSASSSASSSSSSSPTQIDFEFDRATDLAQESRKFEIDDNRPQQHSTPSKEYLIDIVPEMAIPLRIRFHTRSSQIETEQNHYRADDAQPREKVANRLYTIENADRLHHTVRKPVIQEIREIIQPYRKRIQVIEPVRERIRTEVHTASHSDPLQQQQQHQRPIYPTYDRDNIRNPIKPKSEKQEEEEEEVETEAKKAKAHLAQDEEDRINRIKLKYNNNNNKNNNNNNNHFESKKLTTFDTERKLRLPPPTLSPQSRNSSDFELNRIISNLINQTPTTQQQQQQQQQQKQQQQQNQQQQPKQQKQRHYQRRHPERTQKWPHNNAISEMRSKPVTDEPKWQNGQSKNEENNNDNNNNIEEKEGDEQPEEDENEEEVMENDEPEDESEDVENVAGNVVDPHTTSDDDNNRELIRKNRKNNTRYQHNRNLPHNLSTRKPKFTRFTWKEKNYFRPSASRYYRQKSSFFTNRNSPNMMAFANAPAEYIDPDQYYPHRFAHAYSYPHLLQQHQHRNPVSWSRGT